MKTENSSSYNSINFNKYSEGKCIRKIKNIGEEEKSTII